MPQDRYDQYSPSRNSRYDEQGYNARGRRQIRGPQGPIRTSGGGLNELYALQNRNIPAFESRGGVPSARDFGTLLNTLGVNLNSGGTVIPGRPMAPTQFRQAMQEGATPASQTLAGTGAGYGAGMNIGQTAAQTALGIPQRPTPEQNRARLQAETGARQLLQTATDPSRLEIGPDSTRGPGAVGLRSIYGTGSAQPLRPGEARNPTIDGRPYAEVMQGLVGSQARRGIVRPGGKFQPSSPMSAKDEESLRRRAPRLPTR